MGTAPHVLVVGGGATGTAVARDLAMRGLDVTLFERNGLASGATGHMHGMVHSGARYADDDPESARACMAENETLKEIADPYISGTDGLFVHTEEDPPGYVEQKATACADCGIPVERVSGESAREREPGLSEDVDAALAVPDAAVEPCGLVAATALSAQRHGASVDTGVKVGGFVRSDGAVSGVSLSEGGDDHEGGDFEADHVVNATGAWAGRLLATAGIDLPMRQSQGALAVVDTDAIGTVVNRCRPRGEGDIAIPHGSRTVLGATDVEIASPGAVEEDDEEVALLVDELSTVVPAVAEADVIDAYWGVRPLYDPEEDGTSTTEVTRGYELLDHERRDDVRGLTTVVGGKFTTHRLMAERVADHVCAKLGIDAECQTAETPLLQEGQAVTAAVLDRFGIQSPMRDLS